MEKQGWKAHAVSYGHPRPCNRSFPLNLNQAIEAILKRVASSVGLQSDAKPAIKPERNKVDETESKLLAEALNKCDVLARAVDILQDEVKVLHETAAAADQALADMIGKLSDMVLELTAKVEFQDMITQGLNEAFLRGFKK